MKKNKPIYRFIALSLAVLIFTTSVGFTVDLHYCGGQLKSISLLGKAKSCHENTTHKVMPPCPHHQKLMEQNGSTALDTKHCCENKTVHVQSDQDQNIQQVKAAVEVLSPSFVLAYVLTFHTLSTSEVDTPTFAQYKPPLISRDIPVLTQSFLL